MMPSSTSTLSLLKARLSAVMSFMSAMKKVMSAFTQVDDSVVMSSLSRDFLNTSL